MVSYDRALQAPVSDREFLATDDDTAGRLKEARRMVKRGDAEEVCVFEAAAGRAKPALRIGVEAAASASHSAVALLYCAPTFI